MNKTGSEMNLIVKILLGGVLFLTILIGAQALSLAIVPISLFAWTKSVIIMRVLYASTGLSAILTAIFLSLKVYLNK